MAIFKVEQSDLLDKLESEGIKVELQSVSYPLADTLAGGCNGGCAQCGNTGSCRMSDSASVQADPIQDNIILN